MARPPRGEVEGGKAADDPDAAIGVDVGEILTPELVLLAGEGVGVVGLDGGGQLGGQALRRLFDRVVMDHVAAMLQAFIGVHGVQLVLVGGDAPRLVGDVEEGAPLAASRRPRPSIPWLSDIMFPNWAPEAFTMMPGVV